AVASALLDALAARPDGRGAVCAIAVLGESRDDAAREFLLASVAVGGERGREAALALGRCGDPAVIPQLVAAVSDRQLDAATRTACAAALLDLGATAEAVPFLATVILAGTPAGAAERERAGLPDRPRWALERTIAIDAIARHHGDTFGLHPDLAWPDLEARVAAMRAALGGGSRWAAATGRCRRSRPSCSCRPGSARRTRRCAGARCRAGSRTRRPTPARGSSCSSASSTSARTTRAR